MRRWLEFHDSDFVSLVQREHCAVLELDGYVHQWELVGATWIGTGHKQRIQITVGTATVQTIEPVRDDGDDCGDVWDGKLRAGSFAHENLIPLPFTYDGNVHLDVDLNNGRSISIAGSSISVAAFGDARFVEKLPHHLQPDETGDGRPWR